MKYSNRDFNYWITLLINNFYTQYFTTDKYFILISSFVNMSVYYIWICVHMYKNSMYMHVKNFNIYSHEVWTKAVIDIEWLKLVHTYTVLFIQSISHTIWDS